MDSRGVMPYLEELARMELATWGIARRASGVVPGRCGPRSSPRPRLRSGKPMIARG
jgi:hypothetical protein